MAETVRRRGRRVATIALAATSVVAFGGSCAEQPDTRGRTQSAVYCAILSDSVGLYVGNPVTQMGYPIGTVQDITPGPLDVRVDFTLTEQRQLPADVKAIIRSTSILADRSLELVGNYDAGAQLRSEECVPLSRTATPKSLSEVIGSATTFVNTLNPQGSTNVGDAVSGIDQALNANGAAANTLLTTTSAVLDNPDQTIDDIGSIITNLGQLTSTLKDIRGPLKEAMYDAVQTMPHIQEASEGGRRIVEGVTWVTPLVEDLEVNLGEEIQFTLDAVGVAVRKLSEHAPRTANLLNPVPWWVNTLANHLNDRPITSLRYRPPLYRIRTPDGVLTCNLMNASMPGSCANVQGQPYAVDVALLQYVLTEAARR